MNYLLDTSVCVGLLRGVTPKASVKVRTTDLSTIWLCSIVRYELLAGAQNATKPDFELSKVIEWMADFQSAPFDDRSASYAAQIRFQLAKAGLPIGPHDMQIAAIALRNDFTVVTRNVREFRRVPGLRVEDWEA
jgi:tRNA(fMet)-specific endonuclease VapC